MAFLDYIFSPEISEKINYYGIIFILFGYVFMFVINSKNIFNFINQRLQKYDIKPKYLYIGLAYFVGSIILTIISATWLKSNKDVINIYLNFLRTLGAIAVPFLIFKWTKDNQIRKEEENKAEQKRKELKEKIEELERAKEERKNKANK